MGRGEAAWPGTGLSPTNCQTLAPVLTVRLRERHAIAFEAVETSCASSGILVYFTCT